MLSKPIDVKNVYKRERCLKSNKYNNTYLNESNIDNDIMENYNVLSKNNVNSFINKSKSYKNALSVLESLYRNNDYELLESMVNKSIHDVIPYVNKKSMNECISFIQSLDIGDINKDRLIETAKMYKSVDRILDNHKKLSKRFELEFFNNKNMSDKDKCITICEFVDTYNLSPFIKMNIAIEELKLLNDTTSSNIKEDSIVENTLDYFLLRNENTQEDIESYKRAIIESKVLSESGDSKVKYLTEGVKESFNPFIESNYIDKVNNWKLKSSKDRDVLINIFKENYSNINALMYIYETISLYDKVNNLDPISVYDIFNEDSLDLNQSLNLKNMIDKGYFKQDDKNDFVIESLNSIIEANIAEDLYANKKSNDEVLTFTSDDVDKYIMNNLISDAQKAAEFIYQQKEMLNHDGSEFNLVSDLVDVEEETLLKNNVDEDGYITIQIESFNNANKDICVSIENCLKNILGNKTSTPFYILENGNCNFYIRSNFKIFKINESSDFTYSQLKRLFNLNEYVNNVTLIYESEEFKNILNKLKDRSYAASISADEFRLLNKMIYPILQESEMEDFINLCEEEANPEYDKFIKYPAHEIVFESVDDNIERLRMCNELVSTNEAVNLNNLKLAWQSFKNKAKHFSAKEKEASRDMDAAFNNFMRGLKSTFTVDHREQIIKGQVNPSLSRMLKIAVGLAGLGVAAQSIYVPALVALAGFALSKNTSRKEKAMILDEIDIELKVVEREIQKAESGGSPKKYRSLLTIQKNLQRERQRIYYGLASKGKRIPLPSTMGVKSGD